MLYMSAWPTHILKLQQAINKKENFIFKIHFLLK